jgi:hypothetical protein
VTAAEAADAGHERDAVLPGALDEACEVLVRLGPLAPLDGVRKRSAGGRNGDLVARLQVPDAPEDRRTDTDIVDVTGEDGIRAWPPGAPASPPQFCEKSYQITSQAPLGLPICPFSPTVRPYTDALTPILGMVMDHPVPVGAPGPDRFGAGGAARRAVPPPPVFAGRSSVAWRPALAGVSVGIGTAVEVAGSGVADGSSVATTSLLRPRRRRRSSQSRCRQRQ